MAEDSGKSSSWFPSLNNLVLILVTSVLFVSQVGYNDARPRKPELTKAADVDARLWEDPFEAAEKHMASSEPGDPHTLGNLQSKIGEFAKEHPLRDLKVLAVMLPGGPYFEDSETRRRLRYAVLSGFRASLRYLPEDPEHIDYYHFGEDGKDGKTNKTLSKMVAYEWMVYKPVDELMKRDQVLVLWLNNEDYRRQPYAKLKSLFAELHSGDIYNSDIYCYGTKPEFKISLLGPYDSDVLQDMVNEIKTQDHTDKWGFGKMRIYSPSASVDATAFLFKMPIYHSLRQFFKEKINVEFLSVNAPDVKLAEAIKAELNLRGIAPTEKDRVLLITEWDSLYGWHMPNTFSAKLLDNDNSSQCLEQKGGDSQKHYKMYEPATQCIFRFSYARGLDGENIKSKTDADKAGTGADKAAKKLEDADGNSQFDYVRRLVDQVDDLDKSILRETDNHSLHSIKAIGILGSDAYDKLLILQAFKERFPDAVFFTNGVDARFLHPDQNKWARNLIMASGFGLALDRHLQIDIPPFRSSSQTALFLATEMALVRSFPGKDVVFLDDEYRKQLNVLKQETVDGWLQSIQLYEVGRTRLFDLPPAGANNAQPCQTQGGHCNKFSIHPSKTAVKANSSLLALGLLLVLAALWAFRAPRALLQSPAGVCFVVLNCAIAVWTLLGSCRGFFADKDLLICLAGFSGLLYCCCMAWIVQQHKPPVKSSAEPCIFLPWVWGLLKEIITGKPSTVTRHIDAQRVRLVFSMALLASTAVFLYYCAALAGVFTLEPIALFEGVSMWPSQALRFIALLLAGWFIIDASRFSERFNDWIESHFERKINLSERLGLAEEVSSILTTKNLWKPDLKNGQELLERWEIWQLLQKRMPRVIVFSIVFYLISSWFLIFLGIPKDPSRGDSIETLNQVLLRGFLVPAFTFLLCLVVDTVWMAVFLIENAISGDVDNPVEWPFPGSGKSKESCFKIGDELLHQWESMRFVNELSKRVYEIIGYPLIVLLIMTLARSNYFENWVTPPALKLVVLFSLGLLLFSDYRLRKAVDKARASALKTLKYKRVQYTGSSQAGADKEAGKLGCLIGLLESSDEVAYKSFAQRPIFQNCVLIVAALLADSIDYSVLASNFFK